jgi:hypothetical protein
MSRNSSDSNSVTKERAGSTKLFLWAQAELWLELASVDKQAMTPTAES